MAKKRVKGEPLLSYQFELSPKNDNKTQSNDKETQSENLPNTHVPTENANSIISKEPVLEMPKNEPVNAVTHISNSFLREKVFDETTSKTLYMEEAYHEVARLSTVRNQFKTHSEFLNEVLRSIIDNRELPGLKVLYDSVVQQNEKLGRNTKKNNFPDSRYDFIENKFIPNESRIQKKRGGKTYFICTRYLKILDEIGKPYGVKSAQIIEKMFDFMVQQEDTTML